MRASTPPSISSTRCWNKKYALYPPSKNHWLFARRIIHSYFNPANRCHHRFRATMPDMSWGNLPACLRWDATTQGLPYMQGEGVCSGMTLKDRDALLNELTRGLPPDYKKAFIDGLNAPDGTPMSRPQAVWFPRVRVSFITLKSLWREATKWIRA